MRHPLARLPFFVLALLLPALFLFGPPAPLPGPGRAEALAVPGYFNQTCVFDANETCSIDLGSASSSACGGRTTVRVATQGTAVCDDTNDWGGGAITFQGATDPSASAGSYATFASGGVNFSLSANGGVTFLPNGNAGFFGPLKAVMAGATNPNVTCWVFGFTEDRCLP